MVPPSNEKKKQRHGTATSRKKSGPPQGNKEGKREVCKVLCHARLKKGKEKWKENCKKGNNVTKPQCGRVMTRGKAPVRRNGGGVSRHRKEIRDKNGLWVSRGGERKSEKGSGKKKRITLGGNGKRLIKFSTSYQEIPKGPRGGEEMGGIRSRAVKRRALRTSCTTK